MSRNSRHFYDFGPYRVDESERLLFRGDEVVPLTPKAFDMLLVLVESSGHVLTKEELMKRVWPNTFVEEANLSHNIYKLREALGEGANNEKYIETMPRRGYRFAAKVIATEDAGSDLVVAEYTRSRIVIDEERETEAGSDVKTMQLSQLRALAGSQTATPTMTAKRRAWWLPLVLGLVLLVAGVFAFRSVRNHNATGVTPIISRTVQLTTWAGLDFYPSISPDGNSIAFSSDRNGSFEIYVKQLVVGAREVQITSDGGQNFEPAFSPDGSLLAYYSKMRGCIWIVAATGGTAKQLTEFGSHPAWSPDGSSIAFQSDPLNDLGAGVRNAMPPSTIWIVSSKGGEPRQLTQVGNPAGGHGAPSWSPDGKRIVFDASDLRGSSVWSVTVQGNDLKYLSAKLPGASDAVYAADGQSVFFVADDINSSVQQINLSETGEPIGNPIKIFDSSGSRIRQLSPKGKRILFAALTTASNIWSTPLAPITNEANGNPIQLTQNANVRSLYPVFSHDGKKLAYQSSLTGTTQIWMMEADGNNQTQLTTSGGWSAWRFFDGNDIAFVSNRDDRTVLWSIPMDGGKEKKLLDFDEDVVNARVSPDGQQVAFNSKRSGTVNIWKISIGGGEPAQLTFDKELMGFPSWSPDGRWIALQSKRGDDTQVCIIPSKGGEPVQLTFNKGQSWPYDWSPDGDKILFAGQRDGIWNIYWVSRSTREQKQLTRFTKLNSYVRYPTWAPLSDRIAYEYAETTGNIWMIELK